MTSQLQIRHLLSTVEAIARSPEVGEYVIGYTSKASYIRFGQYRSRGYHHLVALATHLTRQDALDLERILQDRAKADKTHLLYQKYRLSKRDRPYASSAGGKAEGAETPNHLVYMAWTEAAGEQSARAD